MVRLADGGEIFMKMEKTPFANRFASSETVASNSSADTTVVAMPSVPQTRIVGRRCGRMWRRRMRSEPAPSASVTCVGDHGSSRTMAYLIAQMTPEEKAGQLTQYFDFPMPAEEKRVADEVRAGRAGSLLFLSEPDKINQMQKIAVEQTRLKIPLLFGFDVIHGLRTILPVPIAMVLHMPIGYTETYAEKLNEICALTVVEAKGDEDVVPGFRENAVTITTLDEAERAGGAFEFTWLWPHGHDFAITITGGEGISCKLAKRIYRAYADGEPVPKGSSIM